jgi:hypothetical protein
MRKTLGTLRLRLIGGRFLDEQDNHDAPMAAVINESFAGRFSSGKTQSGRRRQFGNAKTNMVGVVADFKLNGLDRKTYPEIFGLSVKQDREMSGSWREPGLTRLS